METFKSNTHEYVIFVDNKEVDDMREVFSSFCIDNNYAKVAELTHKDDTILIAARKIETEETEETEEAEEAEEIEK